MTGPDMAGPAAARIFDAGMQPERTALAWRRTALSMAVGSIAALRVFPLVLGPWALIPAAFAVVIAIIVFIGAHLGYRRTHDRLIQSRERGIPVALGSGRMVALVASATLAFGLIAAGILAATALR